MMTYYVVCDSGGPISVRLDAQSEADALREFEVMDGRQKIDGQSTDLEDDLEIIDGAEMSEAEFAEAIEEKGAVHVRSLSVIINAHAGTAAHLAGGWSLWAVEVAS